MLIIAGLGGQLVDDIQLTGIIKTSAGFHALLQAPNKRTFVAREGDKLRDALVRAVTGEAIVFSRTEDRRPAADGQQDVVKKLRAERGRYQ